MEPNSEIKNNTPQERAQALLRFFPGRQDAYALQQKDGSYTAVRKPLSLDVLQAHCRGRLTAGAYVLTPEGEARLGAADVDQDTPGSRQAVVCLKRCLAHFGIPSFVELSGRKGYHLWVLLADYIPAVKVRRLLLGALAGLPDEFRGIPVEIFPKQNKADDLGSLIKLPWGRHRVTGRWTYLVGDDFQPLPDGGLPAVLDTRLATEEAVDNAIAEMPEPSADHEKKEPYRLPETLPTGNRYTNLFRFACSLRSKGFGRGEILAALEVANRRCQQPKDRRVLETIAKSVLRYPPGNGAQRPPVPNPRGHRRIPTFAVDDQP